MGKKRKRTQSENLLASDRDRAMEVMRQIERLNERIAGGDKAAETEKQQLISGNEFVLDLLNEMKARAEKTRSWGGGEWRLHHSKQCWPYKN